MRFHDILIVRKGFTLIEMAMVLVIIGLVVGGVLGGRDLIKAAQLRKQIIQIQDVQASVATFQSKYGCIPGDCSNAKNFFQPSDQMGHTITNGNDDGYVDTCDGTYYDNFHCNWSSSTELQQFFVQLAAAKLSSFVPLTPSSYTPGLSHPIASLSPSNGAFFVGGTYNFADHTPSMINYRTGTNALWFIHCGGGGDGLGSWDDNCAIFTASDLSAIDKKMDDGKPLSGKLYGFGGYLSHSLCVTGSGTANSYDTTLTDLECQAAYVIN